MTTLPGPITTVDQIYMANENVYVRAPAASRLALRLGTDVVGLTALPAAEVDRIAGLFRHVFRFDPNAVLETPGQREVKGMIGMLSDWTATGRRMTLQIRSGNSNLPREIGLNAAVTLPPRRQASVFRCLLAVHRGRGELKLHFQPRDGGESHVKTVRFDLAYRGGTLVQNYKSVSIPLAPRDHDAVVTLSITHLGALPGEEDEPSFFFIVDPEILDPTTAVDSMIGSWINGTAESGRDPVWHHARLPSRLSHPDQTLDLLVNGNPLRLIDAVNAQIRLIRDDGHTLLLQAGLADSYSVYLNGRFAFNTHINENPTPLYFPSGFLTGDIYHLSLRDLAGMQILLERHVLLPRILTPQDILLRETAAPFPGPIFNQAAHRYAGLKAHLGNPGTPAQMIQLAGALAVLEGGHRNVQLKPLVFPEVQSPDVSIVIPAHNKVEVTYLALASLLVAHCRASFEVILVDDASTDETARLEEIVSGITVIHNATAQRFIGACNAGAALARGKYLVLLNNDVEVTTGWLDALIDGFARFDNVGLTGAKLLYPDGRLQDAGGIVWGTGDPWNYGQGQNPWDPRFSYARQVDYLSGAALMTTTAIWAAVGGLSDYLKPMYFEDTDLAFKVRAAGYTTWFIPSATVYHYEGLTSGTDVQSGFKKYQEVNRPKFKRRWSEAVKTGRPVGHQPDLEKDRGIVGRILFIDYTTPRADQDAGGYAAIEEMRLIQSLGFKVTFLPQNLANLANYSDELQKMGIECITAPFILSAEEFLAARAAEFDAFYITRYYVGAAFIDKIKKVRPDAKIILNDADLHFLREIRAGIASGNAERIAAARTMRDEELGVMQRASVVLSYSDVEHAVIRSHIDGQVPVLKCPWVVEVPPAGPHMTEREGLSFLGSFRHFPNEEGIVWFVQNVMPRLDVVQPHVTLSIYGAGMTQPVQDLAGPRIRPAGFVQDVADAYHRHRIFVAPLLSGAGLKGKVIGALAYGIPTVLSPVAAEGIGLRHEHDCLIAESPKDWEDCICRLYDDADFWTAIATNGRHYVEQNFSFAKGRELMRRVLEEIDIFSSYQ